MKVTSLNRDALERLRNFGYVTERSRVVRRSEEIDSTILAANLLEVELRLLDVIWRGPRTRQDASHRKSQKAETRQMSPYMEQSGVSFYFLLRDAPSAAREFVTRVANQPLASSVPPADLLMRSPDSSDRSAGTIAYLLCIGWISNAWGNRSEYWREYDAELTHVVNLEVYPLRPENQKSVLLAHAPQWSKSTGTDVVHPALEQFPRDWTNTFSRELARRLSSLQWGSRESTAD